jgi:hypothetical protein
MLSTSLRIAWELLRRFALKAASLGGRWLWPRTARGVALAANPLVTHHSGEVLPPFAQECLIDVQPTGVHALSLDDQVHVGVLLVGMQRHRVSVIERELLTRESLCGRQHLVRRCGRGH